MQGWRMLNSEHLSKNNDKNSRVMEDKVKESDTLIGLIGQIGRWQAWLCFFIFLIKFPSAWYQLAIIYLAPSIRFRCLDTTNATEEFDSRCQQNCSKYVYDTSIFENTIISEWDLVCERSWLKDFAQTVFMLGLLIGSPVFGFLADRFGRRHSFLAALLLLITFGIATSFAPNYSTFAIFRFVVGFASGGTMMTSFVICMELVGVNYREIVGILYQIPFNLGNITLPLFAYYLRSWDTYNLALALPSLLFLGYFWIFPESPRWLIANAKVDQATALIEKVIIRNKLKHEGVREKVQKMCDDLKTEEESSPKANFVDLIRTRKMLVRIVCSCALWLCSGFYFFGVSQYVSQTSQNIFLSVVASGGIQIPSAILTIFINKAFGRKKTTFATLILSGLCMAIIAFVPLHPGPRLTVSCLAMSCASITFNTIYIYTSELFPTVVRNMGMGVSSMVSRLGSMAAPFAVTMSTDASWLPPTLFALSSFIASIFCLFLPETKGLQLQDNITCESDKEKT